jgi:hypothetical protein
MSPGAILILAFVLIVLYLFLRGFDTKIDKLFKPDEDLFNADTGAGEDASEDASADVLFDLLAAQEEPLFAEDDWPVFTPEPDSILMDDWQPPPPDPIIGMPGEVALSGQAGGVCPHCGRALRCSFCGNDVRCL